MMEAQGTRRRSVPSGIDGEAAAMDEAAIRVSDPAFSYRETRAVDGEERTKRTLDVILVTPTRMSEVLTGKGALGVAPAIAMGIITLALTQSFGGTPMEMAAFLIVGAAMVAEIGLILGCWARDVNTMHTAIKGGGIIIFLPVLSALFAGLPQWIPRLTPPTTSSSRSTNCR
jgi:hypothetical protein